MYRDRGLVGSLPLRLTPIRRATRDGLDRATPPGGWNAPPSTHTPAPTRKRRASVEACAGALLGSSTAPAVHADIAPRWAVLADSRRRAGVMLGRAIGGVARSACSWVRSASARWRNWRVRNPRAASTWARATERGSVRSPAVRTACTTQFGRPRPGDAGASCGSIHCHGHQSLTTTRACVGTFRVFSRRQEPT